MSGRTDRELLGAYHDDGELAARDELIERHLPLVRALGRRYANRGESLDDLVQVGCIGLINAVDRFDRARGVSLETYAIPYIVGEIKRHFRDKVWTVRPPRGLQELNLQLSDLVDSLALQLGRSPTLAEIARTAQVDEEQVLEAIECGAGYRAQSLSAPVGRTEGTAELSAALASDGDAFATIDDRAVVAEALEALDGREREIVYLRFFGELTQSQIAERIGVSQMHVSRLLRGAVAKMRERIDRPGDGRAQRGTQQ